MPLAALAGVVGGLVADGVGVGLWLGVWVWVGVGVADDDGLAVVGVGEALDDGAAVGAWSCGSAVAPPTKARAIATPSAAPPAALLRRRAHGTRPRTSAMPATTKT